MVIYPLITRQLKQHEKLYESSECWRSGLKPRVFNRPSDYEELLETSSLLNHCRTKDAGATEDNLKTIRGKKQQGPLFVPKEYHSSRSDPLTQSGYSTISTARTILDCRPEANITPLNTRCHDKLPLNRDGVPISLPPSALN